MAKKRADQPQKGRLVDLSKGMVDVVHPALLDDAESVLLKNASLDEKGTLKPCKGRIERFASPFDANNPCNGITAFYPDTATSRLVIGAGTKLYQDTPHLTERWDDESDWNNWTGAGIDKTGGTLKIGSNPASTDPVTHTSKSDWDAQTLSNVETASSPGDVKLAKEGQDLSHTETTQADFQAGSLNNVRATHDGNLELDGASNQWDDYVGLTWGDL